MVPSVLKEFIFSLCVALCIFITAKVYCSYTGKPDPFVSKTTGITASIDFGNEVREVSVSSYSTSKKCTVTLVLTDGSTVTVDKSKVMITKE